VIEPGSFSGGGDSGSLIVTADATKSPVGLLFAGSDTQTIANRIDFVLNAFGVSMDGGEPPPPPEPVTDLAITDVSAPGSVTVGGTANVMVTVENVGDVDVTAFDVTLVDTTDDVTVGIETVSGLDAGANTTRTFAWNTTEASIDDHTLLASHNFADDDASNDQRATVVTVNPEATGIHVGDLDGIAMRSGRRWSATVEIAVHDVNHNPINGVVVVGDWSRNGLNANTCTTGELGGNGTCIVLFPRLRRRYTSVTFTVVSLTQAGQFYESSANHDLDGSSNGTSVTVIRP
jgi:hypothetical protein